MANDANNLTKVAAYAIVAIPRQDDYVWQLSSEKVPHLTLLALGKPLDVTSRMQQFIAHVIDTSLCQFGMDVDRRGILGEKSADVLFFGKHGLAKLEEFRRFLLMDPEILKSYNAVEQYPEWTPHLTMGYPTTPAKPDNRDYPGTGWVNFDRIALWTGDYEGVDFPLKKDDGYGDMAMASGRGGEFLEHFGVKGMKWGVHHDTPDSVGGAVGKAKEFVKTSDDAAKATQIRTRAKIAGVNTLSNKDLQDLVTRMNLETQFKNLKTIEHEQSLVGQGKKWALNFVTDVLKDTAASWLKRPGSNASGRTSARAYTWGTQVGGAIAGSAKPRAIGS
jgi:hypothetical protein